MNDISDIFDGANINKKQPLVSKNQSKNVSDKNKSEISSSNIIDNCDRIDITPMSKWIQELKDMPEPDVNNEAVQKAKQRLESGYYEEHFEEEILPTIVNDLMKDWGVSNN